jgi:hypothetical protein
MSICKNLKAVSRKCKKSSFLNFIGSEPESGSRRAKSIEIQAGPETLHPYPDPDSVYIFSSTRKYPHLIGGHAGADSITVGAGTVPISTNQTAVLKGD